MAVSFAGAVFWTVGTLLWLMMVTVFVTGVGMGMLTPALLVAIQKPLRDRTDGTGDLLSAVLPEPRRNDRGRRPRGRAEHQHAEPVRVDLRRLRHQRRPALLLGSNTPPAGLVAVLSDGLGLVFGIAVVVCLGAALVAVYLPSEPAKSNVNPGPD